MSATVGTALGTPDLTSTAAATDSGGDVRIDVGEVSIAGWETLQITRSAELIPNRFRMTMTEQFSPHEILAQPGVACQVYIGSDLVVTGYIDQYTARISANTHEVEILGRGKCQDLADCSADLLSPTSPVIGGSVSATSFMDLAQKLCAPFGIDVVLKVSDKGWPIRTFQVDLGDTPLSVINRVAHYAGYLFYENELGNLVIDRIGTDKMASGFVQGVNIEGAAVTFSVDRRFTNYAVVWSTVDMLTEGATPNVWLRRYETQDDEMLALKRYRPKIIVSAVTDGQFSPDYGERLAKWEMARRYGRSQAVHLTCDSWRDSNKRLWQPNWQAPFDLPALKLPNRQWVIGTVTFRKDFSGTHADLILMPPEAFSVEPAPLNIFDWEMWAGDPEAGPPVTTPPAAQTGPGGLQGRA